MHASTSRRAAACIVALLAASAVAAGCGGSGESDSELSTPPAAKTESRAATAPKADTTLTEDVGDAGTVVTAAGCAFGTYTEEEALHVDSEELRWKTFPPASGKHLDAWAPFGVYDEAVPDGYATHNLEHGGVTVWLGSDVTDAQREAIANLADDDEKWLIAPREDLIGLASNAWAKGLTCPPAALGELSPEQLADGLDAWYGAVVSTGSEQEKDLPAYAGPMKEPTPVDDISTAP